MTPERRELYGRIRRQVRHILRLEAGSDYLWQLEQGGKTDTALYVHALGIWLNLEHDYRGGHRVEAAG